MWARFRARAAKMSRWLWWDLMLHRAIHHWTGVVIGNLLTIIILCLLWWLYHTVNR